MEIDVNGKKILLSENGWLENLDEWTPEVAIEIARVVEKIELTADHFDLIYSARDYYEEFSTIAEPRKFSKILKEKYGENKSDQKYIYSLFPNGGYLKSCNKIAGLLRPKGCS